jgi:hypothetical protein
MAFFINQIWEIVTELRSFRNIHWEFCLRFACKSRRRIVNLTNIHLNLYCSNYIVFGHFDEVKFILCFVHQFRIRNYFFEERVVLEYFWKGITRLQTCGFFRNVSLIYNWTAFEGRSKNHFAYSNQFSQWEILGSSRVYENHSFKLGDAWGYYFLSTFLQFKHCSLFIEKVGILTGENIESLRGFDLWSLNGDDLTVKSIGCRWELTNLIAGSHSLTVIGQWEVISHIYGDYCLWVYNCERRGHSIETLYSEQTWLQSHKFWCLLLDCVDFCSHRQSWGVSGN